MSRVSWTLSDVDDVIIPILRRHARSDKEGAFHEIRAALGVDKLSDSQVRAAFERFGRGNYSVYLGRQIHAAAKTPAVPVAGRSREAPTYRKVEPDIEIPIDVDDDDEDTKRHGRGNSSAPPPRWANDQPRQAPPVAPPPPPPDPLDEHVGRLRERRLKNERDELLDRLKEAGDRERFVRRIARSEPPPRVEARERVSGMREATAVILASDWHVEEHVHPAQVAGRNEYNTDIAGKRGARFFAGVEWLLGFNREAFAIRDVILWFGGDLITGYIHPELVEDNELSPVEAVPLARSILTQGIRRLLEDSDTARIIIPCDFGNHGRTTEKRRIKTGAKNSYEWLMYNVLADTFADEPRVEFLIDQSAHSYVDAYEASLHFTHGDEVKFGGGVGGLAIPLMKRVPMWDRVRRCDYHHIGHFHQFRDFGRALVNGSLIGYSEYALSIGADFEVPQQLFYLLDSKRGKCQVTPIWVDGE